MCLAHTELLMAGVQLLVLKLYASTGLGCHHVLHKQDCCQCHVYRVA